MSDTRATVGEPVAEAVAEVVAEAVETAVAGAEARIEAAEQTAQALTDAALRDAITQRVNDIQEDVDEWHETINALQAELAETRNQLTQLTTDLAAAILRLPPIVVAEIPLTSQPSIPGETPSVTNPELVNPQNQGVADGLQAPAPEERKKPKHRLT